MEPYHLSPLHRREKTLTSLPFWCVVALLVATALLHYLSPQVRLLPLPVNVSLSRHVVERIIFVLPVTVAAFAFGWRGGLVTLALAVLIMLPRAIWLSPYPTDALVETAASAIVASLAIWVIEIQAREKVLRRTTVSRLSAVNAINTIVTGSLELEQILTAALDKVLEVMSVEAGLIFTLDTQSQEVILAACQGVSEESVAELYQMRSGEIVCEQVARSGELMVVQDSSQALLAMRRENLRTQVCVPLKSRGQVRGVLAVAARGQRQFPPEELELLTAIGNAIGVAIENAQIYESMRFYAREITQAQEDERQRIARELHDETIQMLVALSRQLEALATLPDPLPDVARQRLNSLRELVSNTLRGMRRFVQDLRPPTLDHLGLVAALGGLAGNLTKTDEIETDLRVMGETRRLTPERELALFRIAQEALNNVRRHSGASQAVIKLEFYTDRVGLVIEDNGRGFDAPERIGDLVSTGRLGLIGMDERARTLGGTLTIQSEPGHGTVVIVKIPIR